ncbi:MAG TPA: methionine--tRNA ligase [Steroidobacteraceae bacterium]|nr:methionine--tRNA ligase [Steroidobacteraceae bacterium]
MTRKRRILVTSALPYANGPIHLGYALEAVQTDIWARFQRLRGHECHYVCADDTHGTPIMLKAQAEGISAEQLIEQVHAEHRRDLAGLLIGLDNFGSTHSPQTQALCERTYCALQAAGYIAERRIKQAFDLQANMFLPDRYVRGSCPNCGAADQYGDSCEVCGATYTPADLKDPISVVSGTPPVERESEHYFFRLSAFEESLKSWVGGGAVQQSVAHKLQEWFTQGLKDWDISRDAPYFGFEIPGAPGKYFYVWFDAPIGYLGSFTQLCARTPLLFDDFFAADSRAELHHFIGKDILYFHALFWPAVLQGAGMRRPSGVHAHGFLTINGQKMSKSRGTFITAQRYLQSFPPEYLRYYFAAKLGPGIDDMDLNLDEFAARLNADIVGKLVNIASRCAGFVAKSAAGRLAAALPEPQLFAAFAAAGDALAAAYEGRDYAGAMREIMALADRANQYIDRHKPWLLAKQADRAAEVQGICTQGLNLFRTLMIYLKPVLPAMAGMAERFFEEKEWTWDDAAKPLLAAPIRAYEPLALRLDPAAVRRLIEPEAAGAAAPAPATAAAATLSIDEFARLDLRVARIIAAELVAGADKLLKLRVDLGELGERDVFAGIRAAYEPQNLLGRLTVVAANLAPRKMRFGVSQAMVLAAGPGGREVFLLSADAGAAPGMRVK